jgi:hypothetical protein
MSPTSPSPTSEVGFAVGATSASGRGFGDGTFADAIKKGLRVGAGIVTVCIVLPCGVRADGVDGCITTTRGCAGASAGGAAAGAVDATSGLVCGIGIGGGAITLL